MLIACGRGRPAARVVDRLAGHADAGTRYVRGPAAITIVLGTALWLVVAGLVEGFVTPRAALGRLDRASISVRPSGSSSGSARPRPGTTH